jgi:hypothetical protein
VSSVGATGPLRIALTGGLAVDQAGYPAGNLRMSRWRFSEEASERLAEMNMQKLRDLLDPPGEVESTTAQKRKYFPLMVSVVIAGTLLWLNFLAFWVAYFAAPFIEHSVGPPSCALSLGFGVLGAFVTVLLAALLVAFAATTLSSNFWQRAGGRLLLGAITWLWLQWLIWVQWASASAWSFVAALMVGVLGGILLVYGIYDQVFHPHQRET